ncbi:MAG: DUF3786 domain-containing protein [Thermodesulfobacteriota bacterium]
MITPLELVKRTPKTNCGECGYPTCLAFAALAVKGVASLERCPHLDRAGLSLPQPTMVEEAQLHQAKDLQLIEHLKAKIAPLDFGAIAASLGADWQPAEPDCLRFRYLGQAVTLARSGILLDGREPEDPRDQILLYNYLHSGGGAAPAGDWVGLESLPNSISKVRTLATYCENRLAGQCASLPLPAIMAAAERLGGVHQPQAAASLGCIIPVLPRVPHYLLYWQAEPEDGFPARVKVLFDRKVLDYLDLESLVFSAERMADALVANLP